MTKNEGKVLTIGNFDGVHLGHRQLIKKVLKEGKARKLKSCLMTFEPHPMQVLKPQLGLKTIFDLQDRIQIPLLLGIDEVVVQPFSRDLSELTPEEFFEKLVVEKLQTRYLVVGHDFSFGRNRSGNQAVLQGLCKKHGIDLHIEPAVKLDGVVVSSSEIRKLLEAGDVEMASRFLDRPFYLSGMVEKGDGRGKKIGFPTANLFSRAEFFPKKGVYITWLEINGKKLKAVTNVGDNPTFKTSKKAGLKVETFILDFEKDIYGEKIKVLFLKRLRDELKFSGVDELVENIKKDVTKAREYLWPKA